jgi:hypothetical protein
VAHNKGQFPNVALLAKQILGILGSQIGIEKMFNLVRVLTFLWHCCLEAKWLDFFSFKFLKGKGFFFIFPLFPTCSLQVPNEFQSGSQ